MKAPWIPPVNNNFKLDLSELQDNRSDEEALVAEKGINLEQVQNMFDGYYYDGKGQSVTQAIKEDYKTIDPMILIAAQKKSYHSLYIPRAPQNKSSKFFFG